MRDTGNSEGTVIVLILMIHSGVTNMKKKIHEWIHFLLTASILLFIISGIGMIEFNLVALLTFGLLTKARSYTLHSTLLYPFIVLLFLHIYYYTKVRNSKTSES